MVKMYGPIQAIYLPKIPYYTYDIIVYPCEGINALKGKRFMFFRGQKCEVNWLEETLERHYHSIEIAESLLQPPNTESPHHIFNSLNDKCLQLILSQVGILDLVLLACTCTRLRRLAVEAYKSKFQSIDFSPTMANWTLQRIEIFLKFFGQYCEKFDLSFFTTPDPIYKMIVENCTALTELTYTTKERDPAYKLNRSIFSKLKRLHFYSTGTLGMKVIKYDRDEVFDDDSPLEMLSVNNCPFLLPVKHFPRLVEVNMDALYTGGMDHNFNHVGFFVNNPQIEHFRLICGNKNYLMDPIGLMKNLKELTYVSQYFGEDHIGDDPDIKNFEKLKQLKKLYFISDAYGTENVLFALAKANAQLESLTVAADSMIEATFYEIISFKQLKHLQILLCFTTQNVKIDRAKLYRLFDELPQLEHISIEPAVIKLPNILIALRSARQLRSATFAILANYHFMIDNERYLSAVEELSTLAMERSVRVKIDVIFLDEVNYGKLIILLYQICSKWLL